MQLRKMVSTFHKDYPEKLTAKSTPVDSASSMAKPIIQLLAKQKQGQPMRRIKKRTKWDEKKKAIRKNTIQCCSRLKNRQVAIDMSL